jgi:Type II intron maturase
MLKTNYYENDDKFKRGNYVRYADDFLVGLRCSYSEAKKISIKIKEFLFNCLKLETTFIIKDFFKDTIKFLGVLLTKGSNVLLKRVKVNGIMITKRINTRINVYAPLNDIIKKIKSRGFMDSKNKGKSKNVWMHRDIREIIYLYNATIRGIINYYYMVDNRGDLVSLI